MGSLQEVDKKEKHLKAYIFFFFLMKRQPPKSTLFPYTPLFRTEGTRSCKGPDDNQQPADEPHPAGRAVPRHHRRRHARAAESAERSKQLLYPVLEEQQARAD